MLYHWMVGNAQQQSPFSTSYPKLKHSLKTLLSI